MALIWDHSRAMELDADEGAQALAIPMRIEAEDPDGAGVGRPETGDRLDGGGLAGAVRSEDAEDLALLNGEGHAVDRRAVAVSLGEVGDFDDVHGPSIAHGPREGHRRGGRISRRGRSMTGSTERLMCRAPNGAARWLEGDRHRPGCGDDRSGSIERGPFVPGDRRPSFLVGDVAAGCHGAPDRSRARGCSKHAHPNRRGSMATEATA